MSASYLEGGGVVPGMQQDGHYPQESLGHRVVAAVPFHLLHMSSCHARPPTVCPAGQRSDPCHTNVCKGTWNLPSVVRQCGASIH